MGRVRGIFHNAESSSIFPSTILSVVFYYILQGLPVSHTAISMPRAMQLVSILSTRWEGLQGEISHPLIFQESASSAELSWPCVWCWESWRNPQWCGHIHFFLCGWIAPKIIVICGSWGPLSIQKKWFKTCVALDYLLRSWLELSPHSNKVASLPPAWGLPLWNLHFLSMHVLVSSRYYGFLLQT